MSINNDFPWQNYTLEYLEDNKGQLLLFKRIEETDWKIDSVRSPESLFYNQDRYRFYIPNKPLYKLLV